MGQYYTIVNVTRKEYYTPHGMGDGAKLKEFGMGVTAQALCLLLANSNGRGGGDFYVMRDYTKTGKEKRATKKQLADEKAIEAIAGRWIGDIVIVQGDYAEPGDPSFVSNELINATYLDITKQVLAAILTDSYYANDHKGQMRPDMVVTVRK